jgi:hypothetical protein
MPSGMIIIKDAAAVQPSVCGVGMRCRNGSVGMVAESSTYTHHEVHARPPRSRCIRWPRPILGDEGLAEPA